MTEGLANRSAELSEAEVRALEETLDDEYRAWAIYDQVIADFGEVRPFINIRDSEARHVEALHGLFRRYGLSMPHNPWPGRVPRYASVQEACAAAASAEIANRDMYARLAPAIAHADIEQVFRNLQEASEQRHLPAFQRCASRIQGGSGSGQMQGRGRGRGGRGGGESG